MPLKFVLWKGRLQGRFLYHVLRSRRAYMVETLQRCLGVDTAEAKRILRGMFENIGMSIHEFFRLPHMSRKELGDSMTIIGQEHWDAYNRALPNGCGGILVVGHTGSWEYGLQVGGAAIGKDLSLIVKNLKPPSFDEWVNETRESHGMNVYERSVSAKPALKDQKAGRCIVFVLDQNTKRSAGIFVDFFGRPACTSDGAAILSAISKVPLIFLGCSRDPSDPSRSVIEVSPPRRAPADRSPEEIHRATQEITNDMESFIRRNPTQWIWMHRRWKTRPENEVKAEGCG